MLLCALVLSLACCQYLVNGTQSRTIADYQDDGKYRYPQVTVCPEDYSPHDDCVTLDQLMSNNLIKSHTTFKFKPAAFQLMPDSVIKFQNVSNITLESAGAYKVDITCVGNNSGFIFNNISGLVVQDLSFSRCIDMNIDDFSTLGIFQCSDVVLNNLAFKYGIGGVLVRNVYGYFTLKNSVFTHMQGPGLFCYISHSDQGRSSEKQVTITVANSQVDNSYVVGTFQAYAIAIKVDQLFPLAIHLENITIVNNTHKDVTSGVFISAAMLHMVVKDVNYINNCVTGELFLNYPASDLYYESKTSNDQSYIEIVGSSFVNNNLGENTQAIEQFDIDAGDTLYCVVYFSANNTNINIQHSHFQ